MPPPFSTMPQVAGNKGELIARIQLKLGITP